MPLPAFRDDGWLPEGHHPATWEEVAERFGGPPGSRRAQLMERLLAWRDALQAKRIAGLLVLDGSFISQKPAPGDFDCIFVYDEPTAELLDQDAEALALLSHNYCKGRLGADVFSFSSTSVRDSPRFCRTDGFDLDKMTLRPKGVVEVML